MLCDLSRRISSADRATWATLSARFGRSNEAKTSSLEESQAALERNLKTRVAVSQNLESRLILLLVPASVQVCSPNQLSYFPKHISLDDPERFDLDQPQRRMIESASKVGVNYLDLRLAFDSPPDLCPYHPKNLHWTQHGHLVVAEFLAALFTTAMGFDSQPPAIGIHTTLNESK